jgi:hypothetical protein
MGRLGRLGRYTGKERGMSIDHKNPGPQIDAHGRIYRAHVVVDFYIPETATADEQQIIEWLEWEMNLSGSIGENPLCDKVIFNARNAEISDLIDMKCRAFTEWQPQDENGRRYGKLRIVKDGEAYNPVWVDDPA